MVPQNEGAPDRIVRVVVGVVLGVVTFTVLTGTGVWQIVAGIVTAILLLTGIVGFCPLYALLRINTRRAARQQVPSSTTKA